MELPSGITGTQNHMTRQIDLKNAQAPNYTNSYDVWLESYVCISLSLSLCLSRCIVLFDNNSKSYEYGALFNSALMYVDYSVG